MVSSSVGGSLWPLVKTMQSLPSLASVQDRNFVVRLLNDRLGPLHIDESPRIGPHLLSIVEVCARRPDGLAALMDILNELDEGTPYMREVARIISERGALELWPEEEHDRLVGLLSGFLFKDIFELYQQVAGPGAPELPAETTYRQIFANLASLNAGWDGLPKPIVFVEHLAKGRRPEFAIELRRWADEQANRLGVVTELEKLRRTIREDGGKKPPGSARPRTPSPWYFGPPETEPDFPETPLTHMYEGLERLFTRLGPPPEDLLVENARRDDAHE